MYKRYWLVLLVMALLTPLGLLAGGTAWGEWGPEEFEKLIGFVPRGLEHMSGWWQGLFPDYAVKGLGEGRPAESAGYVISALLGAAAVYAVMMAYIKLIARPK